jgi:hypothetical protein
MQIVEPRETYPIKIQTLISERQDEALDELATANGCSKAAVVRAAIDRLLDELAAEK